MCDSRRPENGADSAPWIDADIRAFMAESEARAEEWFDYEHDYTPPIFDALVHAHAGGSVHNHRGYGVAEAPAGTEHAHDVRAALWAACDYCGADTGEPCNPDCLGDVEPRCDICGHPEWEDDYPEMSSNNWNGETGNHRSCEARIPARLEELRAVIRSESISYGEIAELQSLADFIPEGDVELREWAGVPEFPEDDEEDRDETRCRAESSEPGTLLCVLPWGHEGAHDTPRYAP